MKMTVHVDWRPNWSENDIISSPSKIEQTLRGGPWRSKIESFEVQSRGSTWWSRQFNIAQRGSHSALDTIEKKIQRIANDAPRVLRRVKTQWEDYLARVRQQRDQSQRDELIEKAMKGPADFYIYLVTYHIEKYWMRSNPGMEASSLSAWNKIGCDNQFLWSLKEFESTFL